MHRLLPLYVTYQSRAVRRTPNAFPKIHFYCLPLFCFDCSFSFLASSRLLWSEPEELPDDEVPDVNEEEPELEYFEFSSRASFRDGLLELVVSIELLPP